MKPYRTRRASLAQQIHQLAEHGYTVNREGRPKITPQAIRQDSRPHSWHEHQISRDLRRMIKDKDVVVSRKHDRANHAVTILTLTQKGLKHLPSTT